tara:strand:- start:233 stop:643 length:411 start_codon:yes stop_codon:yes gene_type:complete
MTTTITTEKSEALSLLSDIYKDAYGCRPRGVYNGEAMSLEEINAEIDEVHATSMMNMKMEEAYALKCEVAFKELVQDTIGFGANDEKTALKWLFDGHLGDNEVDYFEIEGFLYHYGIMYTDYGKKVEAILVAIFSN